MNDGNQFFAPDAFTEAESRDQPFPLVEYLQLLWFRRKLILAITIFVCIVGYIQINEIKSVYTATSTLMVGLPETRVVDIESVVGRTTGWDDWEGEKEVLRSRGLAAKVIDRLGLTRDPEFNPALSEPEESLFDFLRYLDPRMWVPADWKKYIKEAIGYETERVPVGPETWVDAEQGEEQRLVSVATDILLGKLSLEQLGYGNVINIRFSSLDPRTAARLANEIPEAYILDQLESRFQATEKANAWLTDQLAGLETKVVESERAVELYREEHGLTSATGTSVLDAQLSELNSQLIIARAEKAEVDARLEQLRRLLRGGGQGVETASEVMSSTLVQQLRSQEAQALSRASELSVEYGPKHPRMLQVNAEVAEIRERIRKEVERIAAGLEHEAEFAATKVSSLENSLRVVQGESGELNKEAIQLRSLEREAAANRTLYETFLNRLKETSSTQSLQVSDARVISMAEVPQGPSYPNRNAMLRNYFLAGLLGACALVIALQALNPGLLTPEQVQNVLREYVIGMIPRVGGKLPLSDFVLENRSSAAVEALNSLKFSLELSNPDQPVKTVQVTSSVPEEGKTTLVIALARVVAGSGRNVLLIDGDLRRPNVGRGLQIVTKGHKGISDLVLAGSDAPLSDYVLHDEKGGLDFMPKGTAQFANATDIFNSHRMEAIIELLKSRYDLILVDTPPVMAVADARIIGRLMDKTVFVVRWQKTPRKAAQAALEQLHRAGVDLAGVVLQQVDLERYGRFGHGGSGYYYVYSRYGKYYHK